MARDDRERTFEKALARDLRMNRAGASAAGGVCADAETLAAYHEHLLGADQVAFWKEHINGCSRCQEIITQLAATEKISFHASQQEPQKTKAVQAGRPFARGPAKLPVQTAKPLQSTWRWLAPAGALAAGLLGWIAVHQKGTPQLEVAKNQQPTASVPSVVARSESARSAQEKSSSGARTAEAVSPKVRPEADRAKAQPQAYADEKLKLFSPAPPPKPTIRTDGVNALGAPPDYAANEPSLRDKKDNVVAQGKALDEASREFAVAPFAPTPPPSAVPAPPQKPSAVSESVEVSAAAPQSKGAAHKKEGAGMGALPSPPQQEQQMAGRSLYKAESAVRLASARDAATISAPGGFVQWRVASAGIIEHSSDAGASWSLQPSGVVADLISGSAPSDKVCWIVGRAGTVLRTIDGGAHWQKVHAPVEDDFISIFAVNGQEATVSLVHGSYRTMDAGLTWKKLTPE
jgi:hypothetical protein